MDLEHEASIAGRLAHSRQRAEQTAVAELVDGEVSRFEVRPSDFGLSEVPIEALAGGDAIRNAEIIHSVLEGEAGAPRVAVVLNAAAAVRVAGLEDDLRAAADRVQTAIDRGDAKRLLRSWAKLTQQS